MSRAERRVKLCWSCCLQKSFPWRLRHCLRRCRIFRILFREIPRKWVSVCSIRCCDSRRRFSNNNAMPTFCDVALPLPLDRAFTYAVNGDVPDVGCRVLVPFRNEKMSGVVVRVHDEAPPVEAKPLMTVLDHEPVIFSVLLELALWIAQYYIAPIGEVLRGMLPLMAEVRHVTLFRITDIGRQVLHEGAEKGSSRRSKLPPEKQKVEYAVLNYLEHGEAARTSRLRTATGASIALLQGMVRKKWIVRETEADA